jgi:hypothetical protein
MPFAMTDVPELSSTLPSVRRALRTLQGIDPAGSVWRGLVGPERCEVQVDIEAFSNVHAAVVSRSTVVAAPELTPAVARAILLENGAVVFGRFVWRDGAIVMEHTILGGHTLDEQEVRVAAWSTGWAAGAFRPRLERRLAGAEPDGDPPRPPAEERRGAEERVTWMEGLVEQLLNKRYGGFQRDEAWGYHGGFGSARVFCSVRHYLESSTSVLASSPVLVDVGLTDALALDVHAIAARGPLGRFAYVPERRELWFEHAVLGDDLDGNELNAAIDAVAATADGEDERLQAAHGGRRYQDLLG